MQRPDEQKRIDILEAAGKLFSSLQFHEVRLEDVAEKAKVGKGTIYIYFKNKEDLFYQLIRHGLMNLVDQIRQEIGSYPASAWERLRCILRQLVRFGRRFPYILQSLQTVARLEQDPELFSKRMEMMHLVEGVLRDGVAAGEIDDPHPELTALVLLSGLRAVTVHWGIKLSDDDLIEHMLTVIGRGIQKKGTVTA